MTQDSMYEILKQADSSFAELEKRLERDGYDENKFREAIRTLESVLDDYKDHPYYPVIEFFIEHAIEKTRQSIENRSKGGKPDESDG